MKSYAAIPILLLCIVITATNAPAEEWSTTTPKSIQGTWFIKATTANKGESIELANTKIGVMRSDRFITVKVNNDVPSVIAKITNVMTEKTGNMSEVYIVFAHGPIWVVQSSPGLAPNYSVIVYESTEDASNRREKSRLLVQIKK